jgi:hypothetical protein
MKKLALITITALSIISCSKEPCTERVYQGGKKAELMWRTSSDGTPMFDQKPFEDMTTVEGTPMY